MKLINTLAIIIFLQYSLVAQEKYPAGGLADEKILIEYIVYHTAKDYPSKDELIDYIKSNFSEVEFIDSIPPPEKVKGVQLMIDELNELQVKTLLPPPDLDFLEFTSRGLSNKQKVDLQKSKKAFAFDIVFESSNYVEASQFANDLVLQSTTDNTSFIWDSTTRECFTKEYWKANRMFINNEIDISKHITIHYYQEEIYCRAITLGMSKFGLPDIVMENLSCNSSNSLANLINLTAQTLLEQQKIEKTGKLHLNINSIKHKELRKEWSTSVFENAELKAEVEITVGKWKEGDPDNTLMEIYFPGSNPQIEHDKLFSAVFGSFDEIVSISHDEAIEKASQAAKEKLPELYTKFKKGLPSGTYLLMKFPFESEDGQREWMWVEVTKWKDSSVTGLLQNDPFFVKNLKAGQKVKKDTKDFFDYILYLPDGTLEGNKTGELISQQK